MSNQQQEQYPQDDSYPDLDLDDDNKQGDQDTIKKKIKTQSYHEETQKQINKFPLPPFMGGKISFPPPPPSSIRPTQQTYQKPNYTHKIQQSSNNLKYAQVNHNKQRKNCVFIKNIPKCYNQNEKLTTFFRNYGMVKQIKTNQDNYQAIVRFKRQQDTLKFINSDTKVFNRSYIICTTDQNEKVPQKLVKQRQNDQLGTARRPFQMQVKFMKDKIQASFIYKYRALLFIKNNLLNQQERLQKDKQLQECKKGKSDLQKLTDQELKKQSSISNDYDWTILLTRRQQAEPNKKQLIKQFTTKYGPIGSVTIELKTKQIDNEKQQIQKTWLIQIHFLSPKSALKMYLYDKEHTDKQIKGSSIKAIFISGKLKLPENTSQKSNIQNVTEKQEKTLEKEKEEQQRNKSRTEEKQNEVLEAKEVNQ